MSRGEESPSALSTPVGGQNKKKAKGRSKSPAASRNCPLSPPNERQTKNGLPKILSPFSPLQRRKARSKSPGYLWNSRTGELKVRRSRKETDELTEEKLLRKSIIESSLASTTGEESDLDSAMFGSSAHNSHSFNHSSNSHSGEMTPLSPAGRFVSRSVSDPEGLSPRSLRQKVRDSLGRTPTSVKRTKKGKISCPPLELPCSEKEADCSVSSSKAKTKKTKKKRDRRNSIGSPADATKDKSSKKREQRSRSLGPVVVPEKRRNRSRSKARSVCSDSGKHIAAHMSTSTSMSLETKGTDKAVMHWKTESKLKDEDRPSSHHKARTTVDENGKIRRIRSRRTLEEREDQTQTSNMSRGAQKSKAKVNEDDKQKERNDNRDLRRSSAATAATHSSTGSRDSDDSSFAEDCEPKGPVQNTGNSLNATNQPSPTNAYLARGGNGFVVSPSVRKVVLDMVPAEAANLKLENDSLHDDLATVKTERTAGMEDTTRMKREIRELKLELQKIQIIRSELRSEIRERDQVIKEKDHKISALEKAVESQLDKVDELEEEARRAQEEIYLLESRIARLEGGQGGSLSELEEDILVQHQRRMQKLLGQKEKDLEGREEELREDKKRLHGGLDPRREIEKLKNDNKMLQKALNKEKEESYYLILAKDEEIDELKKKIETSQSIFNSSNDDGMCNIEELKCEYSRANIEVQKKNDTIAIMEMEIQKLKKQLADQDLGDLSHLRSDLEDATAEANIMKSKWEGAQRRNLILEEDIDHWKSVNCHLEDELAEVKAQAALWKAKYERFAGTRSAADISMMRKDEDYDKAEHEGGQTVITTLWSRLTRPASTRSLNNMNISSHSSVHSFEETISNATFN